MKAYDIAIIGAGPGGYIAAIRAAQQGACVCLIEKEQIGGTCLNRGCIPTKALYSTAHLLAQIQAAAEHGIRVGTPDFDFPQAMARKDAVVARLVKGIEQLLKSRQVDVIRGDAALEGADRIRVRHGNVVGHLRARRIILATGSLPMRPEGLAIDGKNVLTSNEILAIKDLPQSLLIVGGGYIGCEFAGIFSAFGSRVTLIEQLPRLLGRSDPQAAREVQKTLREGGVTVQTGVAIESLSAQEQQVAVRLAGGETFSVEKVLVAAGRRPNSANLGLAEVGVALDGDAVQVDERLQTTVDGIYAIGDVTGGVQLAHVAAHQAGIAVTNALGGEARFAPPAIPSAIFTFPEVAEVGLTEERCKEQGLSCRIGRFAYQASGKALCAGQTRGLVKIVADEATDAILGASIVGAEASSLVAEVALAISAGMTAAQLGGVIHAHPTLPELLQEAAEDVAGLAVHKVGRPAARSATPADGS